MNKRVIAAIVAVALAVVGAVFLVRYANDANDRAYEGAELVKVLQVDEVISAGTKAEDVGGRVSEIELPREAVAKDAISDLSDVAGQSTTVELRPGEQVLATRFAPGGIAGTKTKGGVPVGYQELTLPLTAARSYAHFIKAGDLVGVVGSYKTREGDGFTKLIVNFVRVTRVKEDDITSGGNEGTTGSLVTIAVRTRDAGKIINAFEFGKVWLTKQTPDTTTGNGGSISRDDVTGE